MMQFPDFGEQSPFFDAFETTDIGRRANFYGRFAGFGQRQQQSLQGLFEPTFNRYLGIIGQKVLGGGPPTQKYTDFLKDFNPQRELARLPQFGGQRLGGPSGFFFGR